MIYRDSDTDENFIYIGGKPRLGLMPLIKYRVNDFS
jgi:hypothetical protein